MLAGTVEHGDSMGNPGVIGPGDVQWMTAGSGIIHQEMPKGETTAACGDSSSGPICPPPKDDGSPLPRRESGEIPEVGPARRRQGPGHLRRGRRRAARSATSSPTPSTSMSPFRRGRTSPIPPTGPHGFAYVIEGQGSSAARDPFVYKSKGANYFDIERSPSSATGASSSSTMGTGQVATTDAAVRFSRLGQAHRGAGRLVGADRDEHTGGAADRLRGVSQRHVHQARQAVAHEVAFGGTSRTDWPGSPVV